MKKSIFVLLFLTFFAGSAMAVDNNQKKCFGKMHACFKSNTDLIIDLNPTALFQCEDACTSEQASITDNSCTANQCVLRCAVAFGLSTEVCE